MKRDTIAAIATPSGRGGIAIVRVSGPLTSLVIQHVLKTALKVREAKYLPFFDADDSVIDEGIAILFENPHSFTGEDVLELQGHGGPVVIDLLLQRILSLGIRLANPGEFSERAFLNGKLDLAQAESIADLIDASSKQAARSAIRSLQGEFSREIHALNEKIIHLRMYVEAAIDFTDEEIDFLADEKITILLNEIVESLKVIQQKATQGSFLREGITVVIAGEPNVGKSSLLNVLSGKEVAIVTDIPGTTRDVLRDYISIDGMPLHIIDTAGLRESEDIVEQEGIRRAYREMENADLVLYVTDKNFHPEGENCHHKDENCHPEVLFAEGPPVINVTPQKTIYIRNKIDLLKESPSIKFEKNKTIISLSAKTGEGIDLFRQQIKKHVGYESSGEGIYLARRRHLDALLRADSHVNACLYQLRENRSGELAAEDLRLAQQALSEITGEFTADDLLGRIFSSFCVGK